MELPIIRFKKVIRHAQIPTLNHKSDAGMDLAMCCETLVLKPNERKTVRTGIAVAIPEGLVGLIWPRSKLSARYGIDVLAGVVDSSYTGEIMVVLLNTGDKPVTLQYGDKIAQMVVQQHFSWLPIEVVDNFEDTTRATSGINSTNMRLQ